MEKTTIFSEPPQKFSSVHVSDSDYKAGVELSMVFLLRWSRDVKLVRVWTKKCTYFRIKTLEITI